MLDTALADELLTTTRAVRRRLDLTRPVERELIEECLRVALQAPSAANAQKLRWMVVTDADLRSEIAGIYRAHGDALLRGLAAAATTPVVRRAYDSAVYLTEVLDRVPVFVIPCWASRIDLSSNVAAAGPYGSVWPAAWSFQLALRARGLGTVFTTIHLFAEREVGALLGIPDEVTQVALLPVAHTVGGDFKPAARMPLEQVTHWERWSERH